jgi:hypothetical protein
MWFICAIIVFPYHAFVKKFNCQKKYWKKGVDMGKIDLTQRFVKEDQIILETSRQEL